MGLDARSVMVHRGMCGMSLRIQCFFIAGAYTVLSTIAIFVGSAMLSNPIGFVNLGSLSSLSEQSHLNVSANNTAIDKEESDQESITRMTRVLVEQVGMHGLEMLISGISLFFVSIVLIMGLRQRKPSMMIPWIVVSMINTAGAFIGFLQAAASPTSVSVGQSIAIVTYFALAVYFILSVYSYHQIIKIQKKNARHFLDNDFLSEGYHTLEDSSVRAPPYTEKAVPMNEQEDMDRENVLYAKL